MAIQVGSETGRLRKVLLHRPGPELEQLVPEQLDRLLFDDIPYLAAAQVEHDRFAQALREQGVQVVYLVDLVAETIAGSPEIREQFIHEFICESGSTARHYQSELKAMLMAMEDDREMVGKTMTGVRLSELKNGSRGPLVRCLSDHKLQFVMDPIPNLYFTRDPFAAIGGGACMCRMHTVTRQRETIYSRYILNYHPDFRGQVPFYYRSNAPFSIEGGDVLNLSRSVLAVGLSQRTSPEAVELLAENLFREQSSPVDTILAFDIPNLRAFMHLDTVFTQLDQDKFTIHPGILEPVQIYILKKSGDKGAFTARLSPHGPKETLEEALEVDNVQLIPCGGGDRIVSAREQWNDGANTLCVAPGVAVVYDRNTVTNRILRENGIQTIEIASSELSRGRGGPRCMSMPLLRE